MMTDAYSPDFDAFRALAAQGNLIPVYREILADLETPVSAFLKIDDGGDAFLLESVEGGEKWGRYSFLGAAPRQIIRSKGTRVDIGPVGGPFDSTTVTDPLDTVRQQLRRYRPVPTNDLPRFAGGLVGYLAYDLVRFFERLHHHGERL